MYMDPNEIEYMYRHAKAPDSQIGILAELNGATKYQICHVLYERNVLNISGYAKKYVALKMIHEKKSAADIMKTAGLSKVEYARVLADYPQEKWIFSKEECQVHDRIVEKTVAKRTEKAKKEIQKASKPERKVSVPSYIKKEHELNETKKALESARRELADSKEIIRILKSEIRLIQKK